MLWTGKDNTVAGRDRADIDDRLLEQDEERLADDDDDEDEVCESVRPRRKLPHRVSLGIKNVSSVTLGRLELKCRSQMSAFTGIITGPVVRGDSGPMFGDCEPCLSGSKTARM